jgi:uncharacterized membrane protein
MRIRESPDTQGRQRQRLIQSLGFVAVSTRLLRMNLAMTSLPVDNSDSRELALAEFVCRRNCSIGPGPLVLVFCSLVALAFGFGIAFALHGPWLILPFAGIEMLAVGCAFVVCGSRVGEYERVRIRPDAVTVEAVGRKGVVSHEFNPRWARLQVQKRPQAVRIWLSQAGKRVELGRHLGFERRLAFCSEFDAALKAAARA